MRILIFILVITSLVVLGAHFLRYSNQVGVAVFLASIALLFQTQTMQKIYRPR